MGGKTKGVACPVMPREFDFAVRRLRGFFASLGFVEVHTGDGMGNGLSILAACEDPTTVGSCNFGGQTWPLPQTGQMWLEHALLSDPSLPGVFTVSTSYRQEPSPIPGRHDLIFPMFEFETHGGMDRLRELILALLKELGFDPSIFREMSYDDTLLHFGVEEVTPRVETRIGEEISPVFLLTSFPEFTSPFWNMKREVGGSHATKIDAILCGVETIGSAERSCDPDEMHRRFMTISVGAYANLLFSQFGRDRVLAELDRFLAFKFFPRCGGGIGMTRMIRALKLSGLLGERLVTEGQTCCASCASAQAQPLVAPVSS